MSTQPTLASPYTSITVNDLITVAPINSTNFDVQVPISAIASLVESSQQTPSVFVYVDANRTDSYTETGTYEYPYKTVASAFAAITAAGYTSVAISLASGNYTVSSNTTISIPTVIYGNNSTLTISSGVTLTITGNYVGYDLYVTGGTVAFAGALSTTRFILRGGADTGTDVTLSLGTLDINSRSQLSGTIAVSGGTFEAYSTVFTSPITQTGGVIYLQK